MMLSNSFRVTLSSNHGSKHNILTIRLNEIEKNYKLPKIIKDNVFENTECSVEYRLSYFDRMLSCGIKKSPEFYGHANVDKSWHIMFDRRFNKIIYYVNDEKYIEVDDSHYKFPLTSIISNNIPKKEYLIRDYDGVELKASVYTYEMEHTWQGLLCWMNIFSSPSLVRRMQIDYSDEVGPEKGTWKGGTLGQSFPIELTDTLDIAFKKFCQKEHRSKNGRYRITLID